jgi:hypothetical protein
VQRALERTAFDSLDFAAPAAILPAQRLDGQEGPG